MSKIMNIAINKETAVYFEGIIQKENVDEFNQYCENLYLDYLNGNYKEV